MKVWEIKEEYRKLEEALEESGGELSPDLESMLNLLTEAREQKIENIMYLINNNEAYIEALKAKENELYEKRKRAEKQIENLKNLISFLVPKGEKLKAGIFSISWRKTPEKVDVYDMEKLPEVYKRIKEEPDKKLILETLKQGAIIEGAKLVEGELNLSVR